MDKPISMRVREFEAQLVDLVNNSGISLLLVKPALEKVYSAVQAQVESQYQKEKAAYEAALAEEETEEE